MTPNTIDPALVAEVAKGMSAAQRAALVSAELDGNLGRYFARFISGPAGRGLVKKTLATAVWSGVMLSDNGLAVRRFLQEQQA